MTWQPEIVSKVSQAAAAIAEQFPELAALPVRELGAGWDYTAFRVGDDLVFRFPRRAVVLPGLERELATLPRLDLPVQVAAPLFVGEPAACFPWRFYGAAFIDGEEPLGADEEARSALALDLARALRALHAHDPLDLPQDGNERANMRRRVPWARAALAELGVDAERILAPAERLPRPPGAVLCHGDLHVRQLLARGGTLAGIVDWVDVCRGDPGIDLSLLWSFVPRATFDAFLAEYGAVEDESLVVARVLALGLNATLANYARDVGNAALEREVLAGVERALSP